MEPVDKYQQIKNKINELRKKNPSVGDNMPEVLELYADLVENMILQNKEITKTLDGFEKRFEILTNSLNNLFNTIQKKF